MGVVYAVTHRTTGKRMAIKCLLPQFVEHPRVVERFLREARTVGRIQHRQVIDVFDVGRDQHVLYLVMPLLEGKPLSELLQDASMPLSDLLVILLRAMEGVAAAHEHRVIHRDLKPANIFVCLGVSGKLDDPCVLDFGISKLSDDADSLTHSGAAVGTPVYMALEQLTGDRDVDERADVYALGVILYEAMAGVVPHQAENVASLAIRLMHVPPEHLARQRPDLPPGLADVVMRAIARDRSARYPSVRALISALAPFVPGGEGTSAAELVGAPIRTPRSGELRVRELARASAPTAPSPEAAATPSGDDATPALRSIPAPAARSKRMLFVFAAVAVVMGAVALGQRTSDPPARARTPAPAAEPTPPPTVAAADMPPPSAPSAPPAVHDAGSTPSPRPRSRTRRTEPTKQAAPAPEPSSAPAEPRRPTQDVRGDELAPEEF